MVLENAVLIQSQFMSGQALNAKTRGLDLFRYYKQNILVIGQPMKFINKFFSDPSPDGLAGQEVQKISITQHSKFLHGLEDIIPAQVHTKVLPG